VETNMPDSRGPQTATTFTAAPGLTAPTSREVEFAAYASFILVGWSSLFVPSLLRILQADFVRSDAEFGLVYLVGALLFATGALSSGLISGRFGRGVVSAAGAVLIAGGFALEAVAPSWPIFVFGAALAGAGCGATDAIGSSVIMDMSASESGSGLNRLHLFYSVGALAAPIAIGLVIGIGLEWRLIAVASSVAGVALARPLLRAGSIPARPKPPESATAGAGSAARFTGLHLALAGLGLAIACYVAAESGISSWLVGFLADEPMTTATMSLSLFWVGIASGRIVASRVAGRFDPVHFTATCAWAGGIVVLAAVGLASGPLRIGLFLAAGFAFGPVYPMIMAVAGSLFPHRAAAVAGIVTSAGVVGSVSYPPLMGLIAGYAGLGAGMLGAATLILLGGATVALVGRYHNQSQRRLQRDLPAVLARDDSRSGSAG
jgi:fucose permease